jgi:hypothetical protein
MQIDEFIQLARQLTVPLPPMSNSGEQFRLSATLRDGTHLPCVIVENPEKTVQLAIRRFEKSQREQHPSINYPATVKRFVTGGNTVNWYDIVQLSASRFAIPLERMEEIEGETEMAWTEFYAIMSDGREFRFGSQFHLEFFDMPEGYCGNDIKRIVPAVRGELPRCERIYRDKPFFTCYVDGI